MKYHFLIKLPSINHGFYIHCWQTYGNCSRKSPLMGGSRGGHRLPGELLSKSVTILTHVSI